MLETMIIFQIAFWAAVLLVITTKTEKRTIKIKIKHIQTNIDTRSFDYNVNILTSFIKELQSNPTEATAYFLILLNDKETNINLRLSKNDISENKSFFSEDFVETDAVEIKTKLFFSKTFKTSALYLPVFNKKIIIREDQ